MAKSPQALLICRYMKRASAPDSQNIRVFSRLLFSLSFSRFIARTLTTQFRYKHTNKKKAFDFLLCFLNKEAATTLNASKKKKKRQTSKKIYKTVA